MLFKSQIRNPKSEIEMRVLGIDPGSLVTGYGLVEGSGNLLTHIYEGSIACKRGDSLDRRLKEVFYALQEIIEGYNPQVVVVEKLFVARSAESALKLGHASGVAILCAAIEGLPVFQYTPMEIKKALTGYGMAGKGQVKYMVKELLGMSYLPETNASDALAAAICHIHHRGLKI